MHGTCMIQCIPEAIKGSLLISQVAGSRGSSQLKDVLAHARLCGCVENTPLLDRVNADQRGFCMGWSKRTDRKLHRVCVWSNFYSKSLWSGCKPAWCQKQKVHLDGSSTQERSTTTASAWQLQDLFHVHHLCSIRHRYWDTPTFSGLQTLKCMIKGV
jgi:hypothetical protein